MTRIRAFTLIELLIVVAIIAILAAIAVPNFLEAQTRARVSRTVSDLRNVELAMETYYIDNNSYPASYREQIIPINSTLSHMDRRLVTTPIAYLSEFPKDIFHAHQGGVFQSVVGGQREYWIYTVRYVNGSGYGNTGVGDYPRDAYYSWSEGPDRDLNSPVWLTLPRCIRNEAKTEPNMKGGIRYDPTNGTISVGDLYLFSGKAKTSEY